MGGTLTASADDVEDSDGLDNATFAWQWLANDGAQDAAIDGATGTSYEVTPGDVGRALKARVTFTDDGGNEETLESAATEAVVDLRPTVASVAMAEPPAGGWTDGDTVRLSIGFSAPVTVATDGGTPSVGIALDGTTREAAYAGGSGRSSLTFSYALTADDGTGSAVSVAADALAANGGTIRDADGRDASLAHGGIEAAAEANEEPETPAPPLTASFSDVPATHDGAPFAFTLTFSGGETLTLTLSNASGARIADATATGTINNADPVPLAWLVRFGRAASDHAVEAIGARFEDDGGGAHATFAGRRLWGGGAQAGGEDAFGADPWAGAAGDEAFGFGFGGNGFGGNGFGGNAPGGMNPGMQTGMDGGIGMNGGPRGGIGMNPMNGGAALGPPGAGGYRPALRDLLIGSSFLLSADGADEAGASRRLTAWGRAAATRFDGVADGVSVDGEVATYLVGADAAWNRWLAGISVAHTIGAGGFRGAEGADGELDSALTAVHPYLRYRLSDRISAWGVLGYGSGDLTLETGGSAWETDTSIRMAAAGMRGVLLRGAGGLELAAKADVRLTRIASDAAEGAAACSARRRAPPAARGCCWRARARSASARRGR